MKQQHTSVSSSDESRAILIVPRERYSTFPACLASLATHGGGGLHVVVVDGNCGEPMRSMLDRMRSSIPNLQIVHTDSVEDPVTLRKVGMREIRERWVAVIDNDVTVSPRWLDAMIDCARETGAAMVTPLTLYGKNRIHAAGCDILVSQANGKNRYEKNMRYRNVRRGDAPPLQRRNVDYSEFHGFLLNRAVLPTLDILDERVTPADVDFGLSLKQQGLSVYFEPTSVIAYTPPPPFEKIDVPLFRDRWDPERSLRKIKAFADKWNCEFDPRSYIRFERRQRGLLSQAAKAFPDEFALGANNIIKRIESTLRFAVIDLLQLPERERRRHGNVEQSGTQRPQ